MRTLRFGVWLGLLGASGAMASPDLVPAERDWLYFGLDFGRSWLKPGVFQRESEKSGWQLNAKALFSWYRGDWVWDLGGGFFYNRLTGSNQFSTQLSPEVRVNTYSFFGEGGLRYRLGDHWQIGPVLNILLGPDVSFDESVGTPVSASALLGGGRIEFETPWGAGRLRIGAQYLTDLTIGNRQVHWLQGDVQYGIPFGSTKAPEADDVAPRPSSIPALEAPPPAISGAIPLAEKIGHDQVRIRLGEAVLRFETAKSKLRQGSHAIVRRIAKYLMDAPTAWKTVRVEGHADKRGKLAYNMRLSQARADAVSKLMQVNGVPKKRISAKGFGPERPIDAGDDVGAYAINRRVEIWLTGVKNASQVTIELNTMQPAPK